MKLSHVLEAQVLRAELTSPDWDPSTIEHKRKFSKGQPGTKTYSPTSTGPDNHGQEITKQNVSKAFKKYKEIAQSIKATGLEAKVSRQNSETHRGQHYYAGGAKLHVDTGRGGSKRQAWDMAKRLAHQYNIPYDWDWSDNDYSKEYDYEDDIGHLKRGWNPNIHTWETEGKWTVGYTIRERGKRVFGY